MGLTELLQHLQEPWAIRALAASVMVGIMCGLLGCFIVLRNMALIGDALSHAILPGVVVAFILVGHNTLGFFVGAVVAGLVSAVAITWLQRNMRARNDAAIGIVFTAMFALGVIGISRVSRLPGVHLDLKDFLFGNVLGVSNQDLYLTLVILLYVVLSIVVFYRYLFATTFQPIIAQTMGISVRAVHYYLMLLLSFAVVASLRTVGVILVVAMLITPAATALILSKRLKRVLLIAAVVGMLSALVGLVLAILLETPPGPAMAVVATGFYLLAALFAPKRGLLFRYLQKKRLQRRIQLEDTLKRAFHLQQADQLTAENLSHQLGFGESVVQKQLNRLRQKGYLEADRLTLTESGEKEARRLVRAHRLWETWLAEKLGLSPEQIHEHAEEYEHLLSDEVLDEVDRTLGYPRTDPHGSEIPARPGAPEPNLLQAKAGDVVKLAEHQPIEKVASRLWELGLSAATPVKVLDRKADRIEVSQNGRVIAIPLDLARLIATDTQTVPSAT